MEAISFKWFSLTYLTFGTLLVTGGAYLFIRKDDFKNYVIGAANQQKPPNVWINTIKYLFFFTIPCLIFSFFPLSWPELLFSLWCLIIIFTAGQMLAYWKQTAEMIRNNPGQILGKVKLIAANMLSIGIIMFLLYYHLVN